METDLDDIVGWMFMDSMYVHQTKSPTLAQTQLVHGQKTLDAID